MLSLIAGILIGIANETWIQRLIIPFIWGIVYCIYTSILRRDRLNEYVKNVEARGGELKWRMSPVQAFYFVEYVTAVLTSLTFSLITGVFTELF